MNLDDIRKLDSDKHNIYVRWSNVSPDQERASKRYGTQRENGLSACLLNIRWADWRLIRQLMEYQFTGAKHCWIITGRELRKRGGDNEPLLEIGTIKVLGEYDYKNAPDWKALKIKEMEQTIAEAERKGNKWSAKYEREQLQLFIAKQNRKWVSV